MPSEPRNQRSNTIDRNEVAQNLWKLAGSPGIFGYAYKGNANSIIEYAKQKVRDKCHDAEKLLDMYNGWSPQFPTFDELTDHINWVTFAESLHAKYTFYHEDGIVYVFSKEGK